MSQIKSKDTKPELIIRKLLHSNGYRYKLHERSLPGRPDLVFPKLGIVLFVNGCFWHMHNNCRYFVVPKTRTEWWLEKIGKTVQNDNSNYQKLEKLGWRVITIWECELKNDARPQTICRILTELQNAKENNAIHK